MNRITLDDALNCVFFAFYGSLRPGMGNYEWALKDRAEVTHTLTTKLSGFKLFSLGWYPMAFLSSDPTDSMTVDIFAINNPDVKRRIDGMEIGAGYLRHYVEVPGIDGKILIYVGPGDGESRSLPLVESGDWVSYKNNPETANATV